MINEDNIYKRVYDYIQVYAIPIWAIVSIFAPGIYSFTLPFLVFVIVPIVDQFFDNVTDNYSPEEEVLASKDKFYDYLLYIMVPVHYITLFIGLYVLTIGPYEWDTYEVFGKVFSLGCTCGIIGINLGHELGHRTKKHETFLAKALLLSSMYMHFIIEHNHGHHKNVATEDDPATSHKGEIVFVFWFKSVIYGYISAWKIETARLKRMEQKFFSIHNEMIVFTIIQISFVGLIYFVFGSLGVQYFLMAALFGILLLETINYIEHYGLARNKSEKGKGYEKVLPVHSWNSNHPVGRALLMELTRHSDHHYRASRHFQVLRHFDESPQLPLGYPGSVVMALIPPLWFYVMDKELKRFHKQRLTI